MKQWYALYVFLYSYKTVHLCIYMSSSHNDLTSFKQLNPLALEQMAAFFQMILSDAFLWMKSFVF